MPSLPSVIKLFAKCIHAFLGPGLPLCPDRADNLQAAEDGETIATVLGLAHTHPMELWCDSRNRATAWHYAGLNSFQKGRDGSLSKLLGMMCENNF
jgi:hypothetical protein